MSFDFQLFRVGGEYLSKTQLRYYLDVLAFEDMGLLMITTGRVGNRVYVRFSLLWCLKWELKFDV